MLKLHCVSCEAILQNSSPILMVFPLLAAYAILNYSISCFTCKHNVIVSLAQFGSTTFQMAKANFIAVFRTGGTPTRTLGVPCPPVVS